MQINQLNPIQALKKAKYYLLKNYPFYYAMLMQTHIELDSSFQGIAGVLVKTKLHMKINPDKFFNLPLVEQVGILKHEYDHLLKGHIKAGLEEHPQSIAKKKNKQYIHDIVNIAMDAEINPNNKELVESEVIGPKSTGEMRIVHPEQFNCPSYENWSKYYKYLLDNEDKYFEKVSVPGGGIEPHQDHSYFEECKDYKDFHDHVIAKSIEKSKYYGNVHIPKDAQAFLDEYRKGKALPWTTILRKLLRNMVSIEQKGTWKKRSRRFGLKAPGIKKPPRMKLLIGLDASGSVGDDEYMLFFNEIDSIKKSGNIEVWIAEFDTQVSNYYEYKGTPKPRSVHGGTDFIPVHDKALENKFNTLIMFTDGYGPFADKAQVNYNSIWVMTSDVKSPYGLTININKS